MTYQVLIQPPAFAEIESAYRCSVAPEAAIIGREIRQLWLGKGILSISMIAM
jgi:hypothetical protein